MASNYVPLFERYPLRAKKARDFTIWKEGVRVLWKVAQRPGRSKMTADEMAHFGELEAALKAQRKYNAATIALPAPPSPPPAPPGLFDCLADYTPA